MRERNDTVINALDIQFPQPGRNYMLLFKYEGTLRVLLRNLVHKQTNVSLMNFDTYASLIHLSHKEVNIL